MAKKRDTPSDRRREVIKLLRRYDGATDFSSWSTGSLESKLREYAQPVSTSASAPVDLDKIQAGSLI